MGEVIGLLHPGEMGAAVGAVLRARGLDVLWASNGRSEATRARAAQADLRDVDTGENLARAADVILSICPPHAAADVAARVAGFDGLYVDANAIAPASARALGGGFTRFVDGGIVGPPPAGERTRLYLSGTEAGRVASLFDRTLVEARVVSEAVGAASAVKAAYAAWTKGTAALLLAIDQLARVEGVEETLAAEWRGSLPELPDRLAAADRSARAKGWRWVGEMRQIAAAFAAAGLPDGFHLAAAEIYSRYPRRDERTF
jgi:3-hydroxyisobutyrate dehydrogenase-like beta-hydroxyacid dehydrogenase